MGEISIKSGSNTGLFSTPVSTLLIWLGLFTVSWDRIAQMTIGTFNVKLPVMSFALALVVVILESVAKNKKLAGAGRLGALALLVVALFVIAGLLSEDVQTALMQALAIILGALFPFFAIVWNLYMFGNLDGALTAFIRGGYFASFFGVYQLGAFYRGLPQIVPYEDVAGGLGRISAFSYEAGYFGYFMILVIGAVLARAYARGTKVSWLPVLYFLGILLLANTRAAFFTIPLFLLFVFFRQPSKATRIKATPLVLIAGIVVAAMWFVAPQLFDTVSRQFASTLDPREASSNAPRLAQYDLALRIIGEHPYFGVGGGNLRDSVSAITGVINPGATANSTIANNAWLQALLDGGIFLLIAEVAVVLAAMVALYRTKVPVSRYIMAGWLAVMLVASMITSYFFDVKIWAALALAVAATRVQKRRAPPQAPKVKDPAAGLPRCYQDLRALETSQAREHR